MDARVSSADREGRVPRLAPGCNPTALTLTPAQGYLLSRVDGCTPWSQLREIGGLPPTEVDRCLERWLKAGVLVVGGGGMPEDDGRTLQAPRPAAAPSEASDIEIDTTLDISEEDQRRIVAFGGRLDLSYYEILDVPREADAKAIKRAYFKLSKEFHPDRYFRRDIGPFRGRLDRVFRKIVEAYELLSDPATRAEVDRAPAPCARAPADAPAGSKPQRPRRTPRPFGLMSKMLRERKRKAKRFYEAGRAAFTAERWLEASGSVRLAIAFDPQNQAYKEGFVEVVLKANQIRSAQILAEAEAAIDMRRPEDALALYEEALHLRPHDPDVNHTAARLAWLVGKDLRKAKEYAARACEVEPDEAGHHRLLGQIYNGADLTANARREFETALRLDPKDKEARAELKALKRA